MKEVGEDKIAESKEDIEIESEEKARGEKIEVDEDRLPSRAMAIHEHIRQMAKRRWSAMPWPSSGQPSLRDCQWARHCWQKGYFMFNLRVCPAVFTGEPRLYLRFYYCHHGPPAAVY